MLHIGCHLSSVKGYTRMVQTALSIGADTFAFFTRNPRGGKAKEVDIEDINKFLNIIDQIKFAKIVAHAPYTLNPCSGNKRVREFAHMIFEDDMKRMEYIPGNYYNFHPGSHVGQGVDVGIELISEMLNSIITPKQSATVLLETMAGKGSEIGGRFEELKAIIDKVKCKEKMGVCLDTCHISDAGYDISNDLDGVIEEFDSIIGLDKLKAIHLNDSLNAPGSHKDRHAKIGEGMLGLDTILNVINSPKLRGLPFILETPNELDGYAKEIALLRSLYKN